MASDCGAARPAMSVPKGGSRTADSHAAPQDLEHDSSAAETPGPAQRDGEPQVASSEAGLQQGVMATAPAAAAEPAAADAGGAGGQQGSYSLAQPRDMLHARDLMLHSLQSPRSLSRSAVTAKCNHLSLGAWMQRHCFDRWHQTMQSEAAACPSLSLSGAKLQLVPAACRHVLS